MNAKEREGEEGGGRGVREGRRKKKRDEDGLSRGQRKEECIPGRVNPWGLEWLTIPWIRAFRLAPRLFHDRARSLVRAISAVGTRQSTIPISSSSSAIDSTILNIARLRRKWIVIRREGDRSRRILRLHAFLSKGQRGEAESLTRSLP